MTALPRLRQVALAAADCDEVARRLQEHFGWGDPFHDPGVAEFGLRNAVFAAGDTFVEVVAPVRDGTTAGRYMDKRGGDSGYMAIFQVGDVAAARRRVADAGIRTVWQTDLPDMACTHLHPKDTPGAIVSLDWADPVESWRWAGPAWTGRAGESVGAAVAGLVVEVAEPHSAAGRWRDVLGPGAELRGDGVDLSGQTIRFVPAAAGREPGIVEVLMTGTRPDLEVGGVRFTSKPA